MKKVFLKKWFTILYLINFLNSQHKMNTNNFVFEICLEGTNEWNNSWIVNFNSKSSIILINNNNSIIIEKVITGAFYYKNEKKFIKTIKFSVKKFIIKEIKIDYK